MTARDPSFVFLAFLVSATCVAGDDSPRNPFWPQDYEGVRYPISPELRLKPRSIEPKSVKAASKKDEKRKSAKSAEQVAREASEAARQAADRLWLQARQSLTFGPTLNFAQSGTSKASVSVNGRPYAAGDYLSTNFATNRFTWKVESLTPDGKLRLRRIKTSPIESKK